jgi:hypothetical protein
VKFYNSSAQASWQAARHSPGPRARDHERRGSARAPALQAVTPKLGIQARVPEATLNISVEGAGWSTARAVVRRRWRAQGVRDRAQARLAVRHCSTARHR